MKTYAKFVGMVAVSIVIIALVVKYVPIPENVKGFFRI